MNHDEIFKQISILKEMRMYYMREAMKYYDKKHHEEVSKLQLECNKIGHVEGRHHDNGCGWHWNYCNVCNSRMNVECYLPEDKNENT